MNAVMEHYKKRSEANKAILPLTPHLSAQRTTAQEQWIKQGFPTQRAENWKYTSLQALEKTCFDSYPVSPHPVTNDFSSLALSHGITVCFYNGYYCQGASTLHSLPEGVIIAPMSEALTQYPELLEKYYGQQTPLKKPNIVSFNEALWQEGLFIFIPKQVTVKPIIQLLYINDGGATPYSSHSHNLIVLEAGAQATLLEEYGQGTPSSEKTLATVVNEIYCDQFSHCHHSRLQNCHEQHTLLTHTQIQQSAHSEYHHYSYDMGTRLNRNDLTIELRGDHSQCQLKGLYYVNKRQHIDNHIDIHHAVPHTTSTEHYKGILEDRGKAVFNGAVKVAPGAFKADAQQYNHNLLLSDKAEIDTKPQLEIYADDVKCSHGATVGQLNENALFYLQARGIPEALAKKILVAGFAQSIIEEHPMDPIKHKAMQALQEKLPQHTLEVYS
ncbi:MAG: Fe-S cluster assembly protein SufD [Gammaproteobacteria bacterium]